MQDTGGTLSMGVHVGELEARQVEHLRAELGQILAEHFTYPPFFDPRSNSLVVRPISRAKRAEITDYLRSANLSALNELDVGSAEIRRFFERLILRYLDVNTQLTHRHVSRMLPGMKAHASQAAADLQRRMNAYLRGEAQEFGTQRTPRTWIAGASGHPRPSTPLPSHHSSNGLVSNATTGTHQGTPGWGTPASAPEDTSSSGALASRRDGGDWRVTLTHPTEPVLAPFGQSAAGMSPFAGLDTGAQSQIFGSSSVDQPTGPLPVAGGPVPTNGAVRTGNSGTRSDSGNLNLPPDLYALYGDFIHESGAAGFSVPSVPSASPEALRHNGQTALDFEESDGDAWLRETSAMLAATTDKLSRKGSDTPSAPPTQQTDTLIFWHLRYQIEAFIRRAAEGYGVAGSSGGDAFHMLDGLRRSGLVDSADLGLAENLLALADRVTSIGQATREDYQQALMLYLLYHRSQLGS